MTITNLVLIIGTNPLPNYVAVNYFLQTNKELKRIWMFCSEKSEYQESTDIFAENIKAIIQQKYESIEFMEFVNISDINKKNLIERDAKKMLSKLEKEKTKCAHLFYTGGTKSEVVHIYNSFRNNNSGIEFTFSYLSARDFRIYYDDTNEKSDDLREIVNISFSDLCKLHSYNLSDKNEVIEFANVTNRFDEIIQTDSIKDFFNRGNGYNRNLFLDKKGQMSDKISKLTEKNRKILNAFSPNQVFQSICDSFPEENNLFLKNKFNSKLKDRQFKTIVKEYLDGKWFEAYCKKVIQDSPLKYDELLINQELYKGENANNIFELDIVLMKGYQLVGISCTTSNQKHLCKSKGFEVILRTRQIGGTEAKAVLISKTDEINTKKLQDELIISTGTSNRNILVLGFDDWKKEILIEKLTNFLDWR